MQCKNCQSSNTRKKGKTKLGYQQYYCKDCKKTFSNSPYKGRPPQGNKAMTDAERSANYRKRKKAQENQENI